MDVTPATPAEIIVRTHSGPVFSRNAAVVTPDQIEPSTPFTGEYVVPEKTPENEWLPHIERYRFAGHVAPGKVILDVACGTGYGSDLLAGLAAKQVIGGDASPEALSFANHRFGRENLAFVKLDGSRLPFRPSTFDAVVSFETVEHMKDPAEFL
ncbi:MAG: class I SAM-dependent methyltransferase, partial [Methanobacteriota archaeon]